MSRVGDFENTDRFEVVRPLGAGGMGSVYEVSDRQRGERVALKVLRSKDSHGIQRFKREFRALADVAHPNLVALYELIAEDDRWMITMELLHGVDFVTHIRPELNDVVTANPASPTLSSPKLLQNADPDATQTSEHAGAVPKVTSSVSDLSDKSWSESTVDIRVQRRPIAAPVRLQLHSDVPSDAPLYDEKRLRHTLPQLALGLHALHEAGKLHLDIKPSNVLVTLDGRVVLLDFGLVMESGADPKKNSAPLAGTPAYMAPEQFFGRALSPATDWYSMGLVLYEVLTGQVPFAHRSHWAEIAHDRSVAPPLRPSQIARRVPPDLDELCALLVRADPEARLPGAEIVRRLQGSASPARVSTPISIPPPADSSTRPGSTHLVGRSGELANLHRAFADVAAGQPIVVTVHGHSGMGKSALVQAFLADVERRSPALVLRGRCYERESVPYKALDGAMEELSDYLKELAESDLSTLLPNDAWVLAQVFPVFDRLEAMLGLARRDVPEPLERRRRAFAALREILTRIAKTRPVVIHLDDLQWGDVESAWLLEQVLRGPDAPPLLLLVGCRTEEMARSAFMNTFFGAYQPRDFSSVRQVALGPLPAEAAVALARSRWPNLAVDVAGAVAKEAGGSPFFVEELARRAASEEGQHNLNVSLEELLRDRFNHLSPSAVRLLEVVAVASRPLPEPIVGQAAGVSEHLSEGLRELRVGHLAKTSRAGDATVVETFHDRIRETMLLLLKPEQARVHHLNLSLALENTGRADPELLAVHFAAAEQPEKAGTYAAIAAAQAARALAFDRAARLYELALKSGKLTASREQELRIELGHALSNAGRAREAAEVYLGVARTAESTLARELKSRAAGQLLLSGHIDQGFAVLSELLDAIGLRFPESRKRTLVSILARRTWLKVRGYNFHRRDAAAIDAAELLRIDTCWQIGLYLSSVDNVRGAHFQLSNLMGSLAAGEPFRVARSLAVEAGYSSVAGPKGVRRAGELLEKAHSLARELDHPYLYGIVNLAEGIRAFMAEEQWANARTHCRAGEAIFREHCRSVTWELTNCQFFALNSLLLRGMFSSLEAELPAALESAQTHGDLFAESFLRMRFSAMVMLVRDDPDGASQELDRVGRRLSAKDYYLQHYWRLAGEVQVDLYSGRPAQAWGRIRELWDALERSLILRMMFHRIDALHLRGRAALALAVEERGTLRAELVKEVRAALTGLRKEKTRRALGLAALLEAGLASIEGQPSDGITHLATAQRLFEELEMDLHASVAALARSLAEPSDSAAPLAKQAESYVRRADVRAPEKLRRMIAPGFWNVSPST
ncbi:MAG: protein kinase [Polyangiaceae bacterium]|nr:protein kinase [Polyangiaceae bacterium]